MSQREMSDFVKLVLDRMDTNPEEFEIYGRWDTLCQALENHSSVQDRDTVSQKVTRALWPYDAFEIEAMSQKYRAIRRDHDYKSMLKSIVGGEQRTAGTFTEAMRLDSSGTLHVGSGYPLAWKSSDTSLGVVAQPVSSAIQGSVVFRDDQNTSLGQYLRNKLGGA